MMRADGSQATCDFHRGSAVVGIHLDGGQCPSEAHVPGAVVHHFPATASQRAKPIDEPLSPGPTSRIGRRPDGPWNPRATRRRPGPPGDGQHTHDAHWALAVAGEQSQLGRRPVAVRSPMKARRCPRVPAMAKNAAKPNRGTPSPGTNSSTNLDDCLSAIEARTPHAAVQESRRPANSQPMPQVDALPPGPTTP
jgi:hypothetical protein